LFKEIEKQNCFFKDFFLMKIMSKLIHQFVEDLVIPDNIRDNLFKKRDNEQLKIFALSIPTLEYPDTYILAGRLLIYVNIKLCPKNIEDYVQILTDVLRPEIKDFILENAQRINQVLDETYYDNFEKQNILSASAHTIYLLRLSSDEPPIETPCMCNLRQAIEFYHEEGIERVIECYRELNDQLYVHASPTRFNACCKKNQLSSCFLITLGDNIEDILYTGVGDTGMISKLQGGIGMHLNNIRHSQIGNAGKSGGIMPFTETFDKNTKCVNQGTKRNGAATLSLNIWHIDVIEFTQARDNYTHNGVRFKSANTCLFISDLFMERVKQRGKWTVFCPAKAKINGRQLSGTYGAEFEEIYHLLEEAAPKMQEEFDNFTKEIEKMELEINSNQDIEESYIREYHTMVQKRLKMRKNLIEYKVLDAVKLYDLICDMNVKSGQPYITYRDAANIKNNMSNIGVTEGSNLCLEIMEPTSPKDIASCNLGHINLKRFVSRPPEGVEVTRENLKDYYDFKLLKVAMSKLVENINKVIDHNYYPLDERDLKDKSKVIKQGKISKPNLANRPIGIGVSGLAEVFALLNLPFDSDLAKYLNKMIFGAMYYYGLVQSHALAQKHGEYSSFRTGECKIFVKGRGWETFKGSPLSNGFLQFDLWQAEADYLQSIKRLDTNIYKIEDNIPIEPSQWGEEGSWSDLRDKITQEGVYNAMLLAPMPTASTSQLVRNAECFEAHQTLVYSRKLVHGNITTFSEPFVEDMQRLGLWNSEMIEFIEMDNGSIRYIDHFINDNRDYFKNIVWDDSFKEKVKNLQRIHRGMYEISQKEIMLMSRQRGIYVDQSQSMNIYIAEPTKEKMMAVHAYSSALKLKTGMYYLRQNPASQTDRFTVKLEIKDYFNNLLKKLNTKVVKKKKIVCTDEVCIMCQ
jgi:ribonucleoside-diphosphate reductase alpha chain